MTKKILVNIFIWGTFLFVAKSLVVVTIDTLLGWSGTYLEVFIVLVLDGIAGYLVVSKSKINDKMCNLTYPILLGISVIIYESLLGNSVVYFATGHIQSLGGLNYFAGAIGGYLASRKKVS